MRVANVAKLVLSVAAMLIAASAPIASAVASPELVSISLTGSTGNGGSSFRPGAAVSSDGRFVAFYSLASDLVAGDTNGTWDVFVRDLRDGRTWRASVSSAGVQGVGPGDVQTVAMSGDGRYVAFDSPFPNLVPGDTNGAPDVFRHDNLTGETIRVSVATDGTQGNIDTSGGSSNWPVISSDGRFIAFVSTSTNLVSNDTNSSADVFVHDCVTGETERVSVADGGAESDNHSGQCAISADGRYVAFVTLASNLVPGDTNHSLDVYRRDRFGMRTARVSLATSGAEPNADCSWPQMSADGRFVSFDSQASNLAAVNGASGFNVLVRDLVTNTTELASQSSAGVPGNRMSGGGAISGDGRYVTFTSNAFNFDPVDLNTCWTFTLPGECPDLYVRDRSAGTTTRVSVGPGGIEGNSSVGGGGVTADGRVVVFVTQASNFHTPDDNHDADVFARVWQDAPTSALLQRFAFVPDAEAPRVEWQLTDGASLSQLDLERSEVESGPWIPLASWREPVQPIGSWTVEHNRATGHWYRLSALTREAGGQSLGVLFLPAQAAPETVRLSVLDSANPGAAVRLRFELPAPGRCRLEIHDVAGRRLALLADGVFERGVYERAWSAAKRPGVFFASLTTPAGTIARRILTLR